MSDNNRSRPAARCQGEQLLLCGINPADYIYTTAIFAIERGEALLPWEFAALPNAT